MERYPKNLLEFQRMFPDDEACARYIEALRWPKGFYCPKCGSIKGWRLKAQPWLWECKECGVQTSIRAGTVMHKSKLPLTIWFWAAYLMGSSSNGISALQLKKQLSLGSYQTAWLICAKLRRAMSERVREKLSGTVEIDEASLIYRTKDEPLDGGQGRSKIGKIHFIVAVETIDFEDKGGNAKSMPGRVRIEPLKSYRRADIADFIRRNIEIGSLLRTDGNPSYRSIPGYQHDDIVMGQMPSHVFMPWSNRVISMLKRLGLGTYHGFRRRYVRRYFEEFCWRFNRRRQRPATLHRLLGLVVAAQPSSLRLIKGEPMEGLPSAPRHAPPRNVKRPRTHQKRRRRN